MTLMCRVYTEEGRSQSCLFETLARQENEMGNRRAECEQDKAGWDGGATLRTWVEMNSATSMIIDR